MSNIANSLGRRASSDAKGVAEPGGPPDGAVKQRGDSSLNQALPAAAPVPVFHRGPVDRSVATGGPSAAKALALELQQASYGVSLSEPASDPPTGVHYSAASLAGRSPVTTTLVDATRLSLSDFVEAETSPAVPRPSGFHPVGASASQTVAQALRVANTEFEERVGDRLELPLGILLNQRDRALRDLGEMHSQIEQQRLAFIAEHEQRVAQLMESHRFEVAQLRYAFAAQQAEAAQQQAATLQSALEAPTPEAPRVEEASEVSGFSALQALVIQLKSELEEVSGDLKRTQSERAEELTAQAELRREFLAEIQALKQEAQAARNEALDLQTRLDNAERALNDEKEHGEHEAAGLRERIDELHIKLDSLPPAPQASIPPRPPTHSRTPTVPAAPAPVRATGPWSSVTSPKNPPGPLPRHVPLNPRLGATLQGVAPPYAYLTQPSDPAVPSASISTAPTVPPAPPSSPQRWGVPAPETTVVSDVDTVLKPTE
jgi:hypothetical protein